jgi:hypothetical protein
MEKTISQYIDEHFKDKYLSKYPLIFFTEEDLKIGKSILKTEYKTKDEDITIEKDEKEITSCRHFPYSCEETDFDEHSPVLHGDDYCECIGIEQCTEEDTPISRSYVCLEDAEEKGLMKSVFDCDGSDDPDDHHSDFCDCCWYMIKIRYVVKIKMKE